MSTALQQQLDLIDQDIVGLRKQITALQMQVKKRLSDRRAAARQGSPIFDLALQSPVMHSDGSGINVMATSKAHGLSYWSLLKHAHASGLTVSSGGMRPPRGKARK